MLQKRMKRAISLVAAFALIFTGTSAPGMGQADAAAKKAKLKTKKMSIKTGQKKTIKITGKKKKAKYTFKSNKRKIASVSKKGVVKGLKKGKAVITVKEVKGKKKRTLGKVKVTVKKASKVNTSKKPIVTPTPAPTTPVVAPPTTSNGDQGTNPPTVTATPDTGKKPGDPVEDITIDLSKCENTLFEGAPGSVDFSDQLDDSFDLSLFKEMQVEYVLTFTEGGDESLLNPGKIALVSDDESISTNKLDGTSDGVSLTYGMVAGTSSITLAIASKELDGKALGINVQPMDAGAGYSWPESLQSVEITKIVFVAAEGAVYATPTPLPTPTPVPTPTPLPTAKQSFEPATQSYSYFNDYTIGYNNGIKAYKNGSAVSLADAGAKVYNQKTDNPFEQYIEGNDWWKDKITLTAPMQYTTNDGVAHDINSMLTNFDFLADPTAIDNSDNDGKLYVYATTEGFSYTKGKMVKNAYDNHSLTILSTQDMVNWTDEGTLDNQNLTNQPDSAPSKDKVKNKWGTKAWAPSGLKIDGDGDGEDEYYIFYTNGGAVGYVQGDSPTGPWNDDLGKTLFDKQSPNCSEVEWCFDPAVLVDDKGDAYVYFGGGTRESGPNKGNHAHPKTGRVCKIKFEEGTGKVLLDGEPKEMDTYYLFEDSEINQFNGKYCYSYCTNFNVPAGNTRIGNGEIAAYLSSDPMDIAFDPETKGDKYTENGVDHHYLGSILDNPSKIYGESYNNHHHMQTFKGHNYMFYHSTVLGNTLFRDNKQYRNLHVNEINVDMDKETIDITPSYEGASQIEDYNPFKNADGTTRYINATTAAKSAGVKSTRDDVMVKSSINGSPMVLDEIDTGDWTCIKGVNFGTEGLKNFGVEYAAEKDYGRIEMFIDSPTDINNKIASIDVMESTGGKYKFKNTATTKTVTGKHDIYFVFRGAGYKVASWILSENEEGDVPTVDRPDEPDTPTPGTQIQYGWNEAKTEYRLPITDEFVKTDGGATADVDDTEGTVICTFNPQYPGVWFNLPDDVEDAKFSSIEFTYKDATGPTDFDDNGETKSSTFGTGTRYATSDGDEDINWGGKFAADGGAGTETFELSSKRDFAKFKIFRNNCEDAKLTITSVVLKK